MISGRYLALMLGCFLLTVGIETPILLAGLSARHPMRRRALAGVWLTACTFPVVWLVLPAVLDAAGHRARYLLVAETFAAVAECALFQTAFGSEPPVRLRSTARDFAAIVAANLASFGIGELIPLAGAWTV